MEHEGAEAEVNGHLAGCRDVYGLDTAVCVCNDRQTPWSDQV